MPTPAQSACIHRSVLVGHGDIPSVGPINPITQSVKEQTSNEDSHRSQILQRCCFCHLVQRRGDTEWLFTHLKLQITQTTNCYESQPWAIVSTGVSGFSKRCSCVCSRGGIRVSKLLHVNTPRSPTEIALAVAAGSVACCSSARVECWGREGGVGEWLTDWERVRACL